MENLTIYNTYIEVTSQEQADRLKQMCIDNKLPHWNDEDAFKVFGTYKYFCCLNSFFIKERKYNYKKVTEKEFLKLLELC